MSRIFSRPNPALLGLRSVIRDLGLAPIYEEAASKRMLFSSSNPELKVTPIIDWSKTTRQTFDKLRNVYREYPKGCRIALPMRVMEISSEDVGNVNNKFGQITIASGKDTIVRYGDIGIKASENTSPEDLLKRSIIVPRGVSVLDIEQLRPFRIEAIKEAFVSTESPLERTYAHRENIGRYSLNHLFTMPPIDTKRLSLRIQDRIFNDPKMEAFYEESTSALYRPTIYNKSSGTLMDFENNAGKTTDMHYHPGERVLLIVTTAKTAGATLNFCGISENPDIRTDCNVELNFPQYSIMALVFPPNTHHKFHGDFVCLSVHPREGMNIIDAVNSGTIPMGFLENAPPFHLHLKIRDSGIYQHQNLHLKHILQLE